MLTTQLLDPTKPVTATAGSTTTRTTAPTGGVSVEAPAPTGTATDAKPSSPTAAPQLPPPPPFATQLTSALGAQSPKPPAPTGPANTNPVNTAQSTLASAAQSPPPPPPAPTMSTNGPVASQSAPTGGTGVLEYGRLWNPGEAPPAGLDDAGLQAWAQANKNTVGWNPEVVNIMNQTAGNQGTLADLQKIAASGQAFTPEQEAQWNALQAQNASAYSDLQALPSQGKALAPIIPPPSTNPADARYLQGGQEIGADGKPIAGGYNALSEYYRQTGTTPGAVNPTVQAMLAANPNLARGLPADQAAAVQRTATGVATQGLPTDVRNAVLASLPPVPASAMRAPGAGPANDAGGAIPSPSSLPTLPGGSGSAGATVGGVPGVSQINPSSDLRSSMIAPIASGRLSGIQGMVDQAAQGVSGIDRVKLAQDMFNTFQQAGEPAYQAALRAATQRAAANGQLGSGMLNTSYGDLAHQRELELDTAKQNLTQQALSDSVNDALNKERTLQGLEGQLYGQEAGNRNELRGERGYQVGQEQSAYDRALQQFLTQNGLQNQNFEQGLQLLGLSSAGNPAGYLGGLSGQLGGMDPQTVALLAQLMARGGYGGSGGSTGLPPGASYGGFGGDYTVPPGQAVA